MTCEACQALLLDYQRVELEPGPRAQVTLHLSGCADCQAQLEQLRGLLSHLSAWGDSNPPPRLAERTLEALASESDPPMAEAHIFRSRPRRPVFHPLISPLAACALMACAGYYIHIEEMRVRLTTQIFGEDVLQPASSSVFHISLTDQRDQTPIAHMPVSVALADRANHRWPLYTGQSDANGQVAAQVTLPALHDGAYTLMVEALDGSDRDVLSRPLTLKRSYRLMLSTDKPLYQPGQIIHARALVMSSGTGKPAADAALVFSATDPKGNRIYKTEVKVDGFGEASFDLPLADQLALGAYKVAADLGDTHQELDLAVQRYALPKFDTRITLDKPYYRPGQTVTGRVDCRYFFGKPVAGGRVEFEAGVFVDGFRSLGTVSGLADDSGTWHFELPLPSAIPGTLLANGNAMVQLSARVQDLAGQEAEKHQEVTVASSDLLITAVPEAGKVVPGLENRLWVLVARPDGDPVPEAMVSLDGVGTWVKASSDGVASLPYMPTPGRRDASITATAPDGTRATHEVELAVEPGFGLVRTAQTLYRTGETVSGEVFATSSSRMAFVDVVQDGRTVLTQTVLLDSGKGTFTFDLAPDMVGTLSVEAYSREPTEVRRVRKILYVADPRGLKVDITSDRESYRPGQRAKLIFSVHDEAGHPVAAGLGVSAVDESVFALAAKDPALLKAFIRLAESLQAPRFNLNPAQVLTSSQQGSAGLLFAASEMPMAAHQLAQTEPRVLQQRANSLRAYQEKQTSAALGIGLLMLGLMLEGLARSLLERMLEALFQRGWWVVVLLPMAVGLFAGLATESVLGGIIVWVGLMIPAWMVKWIVDVPAGEVRSARIAWSAVAVMVLVVSGVYLVDYRLRPLFASSVNALAGGGAVAHAVPPGATRHRNVVNFAAYSTEDDPPAMAALVAPPPPEEKAQPAGDALANRRLNTIQAIKGTNEDGTRDSPPTAKPADPSSAPKAAGLSEEQKASIRIRSFFPETLFWQPELIADATGTASVEIPLADSITSWRTAVTATSADGRLGMGSAGLKVFQDFFVDVELPPLLTVGDEVELPIAIYNYLSEPQDVTIDIDRATWFTTGMPRVYALHLKPGEVAGIPFRIRAEEFGAHQALTVYAAGKSLKDAVKREVEVRPAGVAFETVANGRAQNGQRVTLAGPSDAVSGASHAELRLYPSTFSAVLDGIENVLRMPSGCFEQTSSTTYPNALVVNYLRTNQKGTPELLARGESYLATGYQRLLSYEVRGGGFEWFGRAPANQVLTAYGLLEFKDMAKVFPVEEAVIRRTQDWLIRRQEVTGAWPPDAQSLSDGLYRGSFQGSVNTTAYVAWALAESGYRGEATDRAARFLIDRLPEITDTYSLALTANLLVDLHLRSEAEAALASLARKAQRDRGDLTYWPAGGPTAVYGTGQSADVETTALAAEALLKSGKTSELLPALNWLLAHRDPNGTWRSTQATILALRALLDASSVPGLGVPSGDLAIADDSGQVIRTVHFDPTQADVVQRVDLTPLVRGSGPLALRLQGDVQVSYQLQLSGFEPRPVEPPSLGLKVDYDRPTLAVDDTLTAHLTARYQGASASGMVLVTAAVPPGFDVVREDLEALVTRREVARYETTGKEIVLYLDRLAPGRPADLSYRLKARFPVRATIPSSSAYLYYQPELRAESQPALVSVSAR